MMVGFNGFYNLGRGDGGGDGREDVLVISIY